MANGYQLADGLSLSLRKKKDGLAADYRQKAK